MEIASALKVVMAAGLGVFAGCASTAHDLGSAAGAGAATSATPIVVKSALHEANTPDSHRQIQTLVDTGAFKAAGQSVGEGVGIGLFNEANKLTGGGAVATAATDAGSPVPTTEPGGATTAPTSRPGAAGAGAKPAAATPGAAAIMGLAGGGGGINGFVKSSVQEAFLAATDPQFKKGEEAMSEAIGEGFVKGMLTVINKEGPDIGKTIQTQLGPIMQMIIRDELAPAIKDTLQNQLAPAALQVWKQGAADTLRLTVRADMQPDVQKNAENASLGASRGTTQGLINAGVLSPSGGLSPHVKFYLWAGITLAGVMVLLLFALLVMLNLLVLHYWRRRDAGPVGAATGN